MAQTLTPSSPIKASHRMMLYIVSALIGGKKSYNPTPAELDRAATVFTKAGGSWERLFNGSVDNMVLLKRVLKIAAKDGYLTEKSSWG